MIPDVVFRVGFPFVMGVIICLVTVRLCLTVVRRRADQRAPALEGPRVRAYYYDDDETFVSEIRELNEQLRREDRHYDSRTLAEMAAQCPECLGDHPGSCGTADTLESGDADTVLSGVIVDSVPDDRVTASLEVYAGGDYISQILREVEGNWTHLAGFGWEPPTTLVDSLPEGDWLRELLTEELVAA
jgi:hypothetical protein